MLQRSLTFAFTFLLASSLSLNALAGYRTFLDPRSLSMGGTGVASATKFNASFHNPALIAFSKGDKPDKIYISTSRGLRETPDSDIENVINDFQDDRATRRFAEAVGTANQDAEAIIYRNRLRDINLESYRKDDTTSFSLLADTRPLTINFYVRQDNREMLLVRNQDEALIESILNDEEIFNAQTIDDEFRSTVDDVHFELREFGATVATTNVIEYNIPISWGFTPKLIDIRGSHLAAQIEDYDINNRPARRLSGDFLEWNVDLGFAALLTNDFLRNELGLDGFWLEGEWVFGIVGKNMIPTDFTPFVPLRGDRERFPGTIRAVQALYQIGIAHYREDFMLALDVDLTENEVFDFEGITRFISMGGEYYWRDDFHLRGGVRVNVADTDGAGQDDHILTGGFLFQTGGFTIEGAGVFNGNEKGASIGFGLAF